MNVSMVGRRVELTDNIKNQIETGIESLSKYNLNIISFKVVISVEEKKGLKTISAEFGINVAQKNSFVIKVKDKDLTVAIDNAFEKADKVLNREHDKIKNRKKEGLEESTYKHISAIESSEDAIEDEIIPQELELYKPMEVAEAVENLKDSGKHFFVFYDNDDKMRVIYKISNNKFGLY
jgi:putative sigma-54 modulation protein